jgi:hypothetical protein
VVIGTECTGGCKSNYHTIPTTTAPTIMEVDLYWRCNNYGDERIMEAEQIWSERNMEVEQL